MTGTAAYNRTAYPNPTGPERIVTARLQGAGLLSGQGMAADRPATLGKPDEKHLPAGLYDLRTRPNSQLVDQRIKIKP